ncbi:MAG: oligoendopeptidase F, partial [Nitrospirae bacterium CG08_land_8_20_14_0_20_52_24]
MSQDLKTVSWDLSRLYSSVSDPAMETDMQTGMKQVHKFRERYYGKIGSEKLTAETLRAAIMEIEALQEKVLKPYLYAQLVFSADTEKDAHKELVQKTREFLSRLRHEIIFFELEILSIPDHRFDKLMSDPLLANYRHYLKRLRLFKPYTLSEKEEQVINIKDMAGKQAFSQLFEELSSSFVYRLNLEGEERDYTGEELLAMLHRSEAEIRERAFSAFLDRHGENALVLSSVFNNIFLDHSEECHLRGYKDPITATHLTNELSHETIERMME